MTAPIRKVCAGTGIRQHPKAPCAERLTCTGVTATRDRHGDLDEDRAEPAWDERPILGRSRGLPWWGAVLLAVGLTVVGAVIDMKSGGSLGSVFQGAYVAGCVAAVCLVRRRNLFGPVVQPPLVFALVSIAANVLLGPGGGGGLKGLLFNVALPLTSNFPTMAITTGVVLAIGLARYFLQRDPAPRTRANKSDGEGEPVRRPRPAEGKRPAADAPARRPSEDAPRRKRPAEEPARRPRPASDGRGAQPRKPAGDKPVRRPRPER